MTSSEAGKLAQALTGMQQRLLRQPALATEMERARREFFGLAVLPRRSEGAMAMADLRFTEWFLLERPSAVLGSVPFDAVPSRPEEAGLQDSLVGVFTIEAMLGSTAEARDLHDGDRLELSSTEHELRQGDLLVGRLYPREDGSLMPSAAVAVYRPGAELAAAFQRDLVRLDLERRLTQQELEQLLIVRAHAATQLAKEIAEPDRVPLEHLEAELEQLLLAGDTHMHATEVSQALKGVERPGQIIGPLLDELAFETKVDIDKLRPCLLAIWAAHQTNAAAQSAPMADQLPEPQPGETLGELLVRRLDAGLAKKQDVDELFRQLEQMAGIEPEEIEALDSEPDAEADPYVDPEDEDAVVPRAPPPEIDGEFGDLGPLVQEYVWETNLTDGPSVRTLQMWVRLQHNAALPRTNLEWVTSLDLMRVLLHVYLGALPNQRSKAVRVAYDAIAAFYRWAEATQEWTLQEVLQECRGTLLDHLDRLEAAGLALSSQAPADPQTRPLMLRVEDVGPQGFGVRVDGGDTCWIDAPKATVRLLRPGDLLLAALEPRSTGGGTLAGMVVALPADADALIG